MKHVKGESVCYNNGGVKLETPIPFPFEYDEFESYAEMVAANAGLSEKEQLKARNAKLRNASRTEAQNAALDAAGIVRQTAENNDQIRLRDMVKTLLTAKLPNGEPKYSLAQARETAETLVGVEFAD